MLMQGRRRPFPAGPKRANKQRAEARLVLPSFAPDGRHERRRRARFPLLPAMPDRPRTVNGFRAGEADRGVVPHPRNGRDRGLGRGLVASLNPPGRTAGSPCCLGRGRCGPTFSGRGRRRPDKAIRPGNARRPVLSDEHDGRPAPLLSRAGPAAGPGAARSRHVLIKPRLQTLRPGDRTPGATGCRRSRHCSEKQWGGLQRSLLAPAQPWPPKP